MANLFINPKEHRLRALWRLILQVVLLLLLQTGVGVILLAFPQGQQAIMDPTNPILFTQNPGLALVSILGLFAATVLSVWLAGRWFDRRRFADFGLHVSPRWWSGLFFGMLLGAALMVVIFLIELAAGWITVTGAFESFVAGLPIGWALFNGLALFISVGIYEELLFRGYQLQNLAEGINGPQISPGIALLIGYGLSSAIFGVMHALNPNATLISTVNIMIAGLFLGLGYILTGELAIPIGLHITWNFFQGYVFGFPVSGTTPAGSMISIQQGGPDLLTGGAFGPEAGLVGLLAMLIGSVLIILWVRRVYGRVALAHRIPVYQSSLDDGQED